MKKLMVILNGKLGNVSVLLESGKVSSAFLQSHSCTFFKIVVALCHFLTFALKALILTY